MNSTKRWELLEGKKPWKVQVRHSLQPFVQINFCNQQFLLVSLFIIFGLCAIFLILFGQIVQRKTNLTFSIEIIFQQHSTLPNIRTDPIIGTVGSFLEIC